MHKKNVLKLREVIDELLVNGYTDINTIVNACKYAYLKLNNTDLLLFWNYYYLAYKGSKLSIVSDNNFINQHKSFFDKNFNFKTIQEQFKYRIKKEFYFNETVEVFQKKRKNDLTLNNYLDKFKLAKKSNNEINIKLFFNNFEIIFKKILIEKFNCDDVNYEINDYLIFKGTFKKDNIEYYFERNMNYSNTIAFYYKENLLNVIGEWDTFFFENIELNNL